jgi:hypothetical protein
MEAWRQVGTTTRTPEREFDLSAIVVASNCGHRR